MARDFHKFEIFNIAYKFVLQVYKLTEQFPDHENKNITSQLRRAATSIVVNIAEGSTRRSNKEFLQFLIYSYGSSKETEVLLALSKDLAYLHEKEFLAIKRLNHELSAKLFRFMQDVESRETSRTSYTGKKEVNLLKAKLYRIAQNL